MTVAHGGAQGLYSVTPDLTTLGKAEVGTRLNLEVDIIAKYVERLLGSGGDKPGGGGNS